jgi:hypothetical protein
MPLALLRKLLGLRPPAGENTDPVRAAAERFQAWARGRAPQAATHDDSPAAACALVDAALEAARPSPPGAPPEALAADAAAFLGESVRRAHGGAWREDPFLGFVVSGVGGHAHLSLLPLAMVEKKWELGAGLRLDRFAATLPERLTRRAAHAAPDLPPPAELILDPGRGALAVASDLASHFREDWRARFRAAPPLSLAGVREAERFLRSQFFLCGIDEAFVLRLGGFVGEVARGLYQGEWSADEARATGAPERLALVHPELPLYPVGRCLRLWHAKPEGEALDEFIRVIPSARSELRRRQPSAPSR